MVKFMDRLTEMVAGRVTVEKHERRALERHYENKGTEALLRSLSVMTTPEPTPSILSSQCSISSSSTSSPATMHTSSSFISSTRAPCPHKLQRSHSDVSPTVIYFSASGAPDLTAIDLSDDELRRTYSTNNIWDSKRQKLAPILPCSGLGKFRMSVEAEPEYQLEKLRKKLGDLPLEMVDLMGPSDVNTSIGHAVWEKFRSEQISRQNSFASSRSSVSVEFIEPATGTRVTRGFTPSLPSSLKGSPRGRHTNGRTSSTLSAFSSTAGTSGSSSLHSSRHHSNRSSDANVLSPLSTIREIQKQKNQSAKKIEVPCDFDDSRDHESALASDFEDGSWDELLENNIQVRRSSELSRLIQERKNTRQGPRRYSTRPQPNRTKTDSEDPFLAKGPCRPALDRSRTVRVSRPQFRRGHLRGQPNGTAKHAGVVKDQDKQEPLPLLEGQTNQHAAIAQESTVAQHGPPKSAQSSTDVDDSPGDLDLWMVDVSQMKKAQSTAGFEHTHSSPAKFKVNSQAAKALNQQDRSIRQRQRSGTAFRTTDTLKTTIKKE